MKETSYIHFRGQHKTFFTIGEEGIEQSIIKTTPTDILKFIPDDAYQHICSIIEKIFITEEEESYIIEMPSIIQTKKGFFEEISDLNGIAIPCIYYDLIRSIWLGTEINKTKDSVLYELIELN